MFVATELTQGERHLESSEKGMECKTVALKEFWQIVSTGEIKDGPTLAAISIAQNVLKIF